MIDQDRLVVVAGELPEVGGVPGLDPVAHYIEGPRDAVIAFIVCLDAINFGSGWWPTVRKRAGRSGYLTMAGGLADRFRAADLQAAGVASFSDVDRLTAFADNLVPHVLARDGVLNLTDDLAGRIACGQLLTHDSPEEVELRACALHAVELLASACDRRLSPAEIDMVIWTKGQDPRYKAHPRPRARTTAY
jgi:hypothetical protein